MNGRHERNADGCTDRGQEEVGERGADDEANANADQSEGGDLGEEVEKNTAARRRPWSA
jgi:hypothetical protein